MDFFLCLPRGVAGIFSYYEVKMTNNDLIQQIYYYEIYLLAINFFSALMRMCYSATN